MTTVVNTTSPNTSMVGSATAPSSNTASTNTVNPDGQLNENSFLQLLVTQLQNQDPLAPQDNTQMIAQLAQFSALEQMTNVAQTDSQVLSAIQTLTSETNLMLAHQLLGTQVKITDNSGQQVQGTVSAVSLSQGSPQVVVNGISYPITQVVQMS
ncbi:flagellar hook capping protein [Alicyclobacillus hesperidum URH17-3-68]|uniref:Flagellar basal-body rod modification protein FlgD n=1 Tax=Alicyclobacillus hesperidum TaxID=89784 RepID=A0A1H2SG00_9BACL|nr:flagellar hook capping FlgD N-terminal domain-containing protein [Alicyclobacillus hesperidum]EJY55641.1 flagellar hook capping protein [Alicyclobacillus hesperidum URH17-3-68]SDW30633.1 flagellar basal-body rod modification protein FlgD [Alicyclobacillus hesperidum]